MFSCLNLPCARQKITYRILGISLMVISFAGGCGPSSSDIRVLSSLDGYPISNILWSPSGELLAVTTHSGSRNASAIYVLDVATNELRLLRETDHGLFDLQTWSPDGASLIVYINSSNEFASGLWSMDILAATPPEHFMNEQIIYSWSSDGHIAIGKGTDDNEISVFVRDPQSNKEMLIFQELGVSVGPFSWSADGTVLAFEFAPATERRRDIYVFDIGRTPPLQPVATGGTNDSPSLSPDGSMLAYVKGDFSGSVPRYNLQIMNSDGTCDTPVVALKSLGRPAWSPDGDSIAYTEGGNQIFLMDLSERYGPEFQTSGLLCGSAP